MSLERKRILIVEDSSQNRVVYQMMMIKAKAQVTFDRWGRDTLNLMDKLPAYDLIIMDLMLSLNRTGYEVFEDIRNIEAYANIPIVAVSAADPSTAIPKVKEMGFDGFIAKPINDEVFIEQLARIIDGEKIWDAGIV